MIYNYIKRHQLKKYKIKIINLNNIKKSFNNKK